MPIDKKYLKLFVNQSPEVLERILRVTRHRGFKIDSLQWTNETGELLLTVSSQRELHLLESQLIKLFDVKEVSQFKELPCTKSA